MQRIVITHISGSKTQQSEEFTVEAARDLMIGRDPAAQIRFDADKDDLVGRQHARILQDPGDPLKYSLVDLNSRNGTFINRQRVIGTAMLAPGDVVQLGPGGPEFRFAFDPMPEHLVKTTRLSAAPVSGVQATRQISTAQDPRVTVGKATVERMVGNARNEGRRNLLALAGVVVLAAAGAAIWWRTRPEPVKPMNTQDIATAASSSVVQIEMAWHLVFTETGEQVYQQYVLLKDNGQVIRVPIFEKNSNGVIVPKLTLSKGANEENAAIACGGNGTGFVVTTDGFIMTNRHVGANWESYYSCFPSSGPALLFTPGEKEPQAITMANVPRWVPAMDGRQISGKAFSGQNTMLDVVFRLDKRRIPATVANISDRADVALIKINTPQALKKLDMVDTYDTAAVGQPITVLGYPAVSPGSVVELASLDPLARERRWTTVPDPTVTPGTIGRIFRGAMQTQTQTSQSTIAGYESGMGDTYQLTATATGAGNSGGPVMDDRGHVVGIFTYAKAEADATRITFAVPIRFAMELMSMGSAVK